MRRQRPHGTVCAAPMQSENMFSCFHTGLPRTPLSPHVKQAGVPSPSCRCRVRGPDKSPAGLEQWGWHEPALPRGRPSSCEPPEGLMLQSVSEAYQPPRGQQQPPALRDAPAQRAQEWCFVSRQQAQPPSSSRHRPSSQDSAPADLPQVANFLLSRRKLILRSPDSLAPQTLEGGGFQPHFPELSLLRQPCKCTSGSSALPCCFLFSNRSPPPLSRLDVCVGLVNQTRHNGWKLQEDRVHLYTKMSTPT